MENYERVSRIKSNRKEVDTRIILHALQGDIKVIVVSKDADVLILLVYAYVKYKPTKEPYMKIDANKFASISRVSWEQYFSLPSANTCPYW